MTISPYNSVSKKSATDIIGLPDRRRYGNPMALRENQVYRLFLQLHKARRAREHTDLRIGNPYLNLLSWAVPKGMPEPGEKRLAIQQPLHDYGYGSFSGTIGKGYGAGTVQNVRSGGVLVTKVKPGSISLTTTDKKYPERYVLVAPKGKTRDWLMLNVTPTEAVPYKKVHYKKIPPEKVEPLLDNLDGGSVQGKIDGAAALVQLMKDGPEISSYRVSEVTGNPIIHTERALGGRPQINIPPHLQGSILKGELYGVDKATGESIPVQALGGLLNSGLGKSLDTQRKSNSELKVMAYDVQRKGKEDVDFDEIPYHERQKMVDEILTYLPDTKFHAPETATSTGKARAMFKRIQEGKDPLTHEGIIIHPSKGKPIKSKFQEEADVLVTGWAPGQGKYQGNAAGALTYALEQGGPTVGEVGTGFTDQTRRDIAEDPSGFIGRWAKIIAQEQLPSGAYRAPVYHGFSEDLPMSKAARTRP